MPRPKKEIPSLRRHSGGNAVVSLTDCETGERREFSCGPFGSRGAQQEYERIVGDWIARGKRLPAKHAKADATGAEPGVSNNEMWLAFLEKVVPKYSSDSERNHYRKLAGLVRVFFGAEPASSMSPRRLVAIRERLVEQGHCRKFVNLQMVRLKRAYRWAASMEMIGGEVPFALSTVRPLGRGEARESPKVKPAPTGALEKVLPYLPRGVAGILQLMQFTGARHSELRRMRPCDLDTSRPVWIYMPTDHKTSGYGHERKIYLRPSAVEVLKPFLAGLADDDSIFSPARLEAERLEGLERKTPMTPSQRDRKASLQARAKLRKRPPSEVYTGSAIAKALSRAIDEANADHEARRLEQGLPPSAKPYVAKFTPHQIRHSAGTDLRSIAGVEVASIFLGHSSPIITDQVYAERDENKLLQLLEQLG